MGELTNSGYKYIDEETKEETTEATKDFTKHSPKNSPNSKNIRQRSLKLRKRHLLSSLLKCLHVLSLRSFSLTNTIMQHPNMLRKLLNIATATATATTKVMSVEEAEFSVVRLRQRMYTLKEQALEEPEDER